MASSTKGMVFDLVEMPFSEILEYHPERFDQSVPLYIMVGYSKHMKTLIFNFCSWKPSFESPEKVIWLSEDHYRQLQMIRHLDWETILNYFEPLNLFEE